MNTDEIELGSPRAGRSGNATGKRASQSGTNWLQNSIYPCSSVVGLRRSGQLAPDFFVARKVFNAALPSRSRVLLTASFVVLFAQPQIGLGIVRLWRLGFLLLDQR